MKFNLWSRRPKKQVQKTASESMPLHDKVIDDLMSEAIAAPKSAEVFQPIDMVTSSQSIPGKFNYTSSTWKYIENYFKARTIELHRRNENTTLTMEKTQLIRGQLKEIKLLLNHINQVTGITPPPTKTTLDQSSTVRGNNYE